jgi:polyhydroxyalkanoate synthesis regulator phasin
MANFEDIAKRAFYMGVGFASYAQEKASDTVKDLRVQAQKLAEEMAERGEMSTEEARKFVDDLVEQAQQGTVAGSTNQSTEKEPRRIEIVDEVESTPPPAASREQQPAQSNSNHDDLRQQVQSLQEELRRLKQEM